MEYGFEELENADLVIDAIYKGGTVPNMSAEPFHKLLPKSVTKRWFWKICVCRVIYFDGRVGVAGLSG